MEELSASEIQRFLDPNTFARPKGANGARKTDNGEQLKKFGKSQLTTDSLRQSEQVLRRTFDRLEQILGNLSTSKNLSEEAANTADKEVRETNFAKMRSLAAGIDQLADQSRFRNERLLDGSPANLTAEINGGKQTLDLENLLTFGEDSALNLTRLVDTAEVEVFESESAVQLNSNSPVPGIEFGDGKFVETKEGKELLKDGDYRLRVTYRGEDSTVELTNQALVPIETVNNVDLSGDGNEKVDFGNGLQIEINKSTEFSPEGVDKIDFEENGPGTVFGDVSFVPLRRQELAADSGSKTVKQASVQDDGRTVDGEKSLEITGARLSENAKLKKEEIEDIQVKINFFGETSSLSLRDGDGRVIGFASGADLSKQGTNQVQFDNGLILDIENDGFGNEPVQTNGSISIQEKEIGTSRSAKLAEEAETTATGSEGGEVTIQSIGKQDGDDVSIPLENGEYELDLRFFGENSIATIKDSEGNNVDFIGNLDLSKEGENVVQLSNGLQMTVNVDNFKDTGGRIQSSFVVEESSTKQEEDVFAEEAEANLLSTGTLTDDQGGTLTVEKFQTGTVTDDESLKQGQYEAEIRYFEENSFVRLKDEEGNVVKSAGNLDLSNDGESVVDFGNGLQMVVNNNGFDEFGGITTAKAEYKPAITGVTAGFDFEAYAEQAEEAIEVVREQIELVDDTFVEVNRNKQLKQRFEQIGNQARSGGGSAIRLLSSQVNQQTAILFSAGQQNSQASQNIQRILATAGQDNQPQFSSADLLRTTGAINQNNVFNLLNAQNQQRIQQARNNLS